MARLMRSVDRGLLWRYLGFTATEDGRGCGANGCAALADSEDGREILEQCGLISCFSRANNCRGQSS